MRRYQEGTAACRAGFAAALFLATVAVVPAYATGTIRCESKAPVKVEGLGNLSAGMGDRLIDLQAALDARSEGIEQDLTRHVFTGSDVAQWWLDEESLRMRLYWEREGEARFGTSELIIKAKVRPDDESVFSGSIRLMVFDNLPDAEPVRWQAESAIECNVE